VRLVDVNTESYEVARSYMTRLEPADFEEPALSRLAACANLAPDAFRARFLPTVQATTSLPRMALKPA
jgi:6-phosphofructokinase 1